MKSLNLLQNNMLYDYATKVGCELKNGPYSYQNILPRNFGEKNGKE